jgi:hypothetical protein
MPFLLSKARVILCAMLAFALATRACAGQKIIESKRDHDLTITLLNPSGRLMPERSEYCLRFSSIRDAKPIYVDDVSMELAQQVGRVRERVGKASLAPGSLGQYCAQVDLGRRYYRVAYYYANVHYTDSFKKKRHCRLFLAMR